MQRIRTRLETNENMGKEILHKGLHGAPHGAQVTYSKPYLDKTKM